MNTPYTIKNLLYNLKREYGNYAVLYKRIVNSVDLQTGEKDVTETTYEIDRCIILSSKLFSKFYLLNQMPAFKYGGEIDLEKRILIIDEIDLPEDLTIGSEDYFIINHKRYIVAESGEWQNKSAYSVLVQESKNTAPDEIIILSVSDFINLTSGFGTNSEVIDELSISDIAIASI